MEDAHEQLRQIHQAMREQARQETPAMAAMADRADALLAELRRRQAPKREQV